MTAITQEQFEAAKGAAQSAISGQRCALTAALTTLGITITPAEPPAEMVKLAREIADRAAGYCDPAEKHPCQKVALATLQHVVDVVKVASGRDVSGVRYVSVPHILTALGAGGRDAG